MYYGYTKDYDLFLQENKNNEIIEKNILFTYIGYSNISFFFCQNLNMMISVLYIESEPNLRGRNFNYALY